MLYTAREGVLLGTVYRLLNTSSGLGVEGFRFRLRGVVGGFIACASLCCAYGMVSLIVCPVLYALCIWYVSGMSRALSLIVCPVLYALCISYVPGPGLGAQTVPAASNPSGGGTTRPCDALRVRGGLGFRV